MKNLKYFVLIIISSLFYFFFGFEYMPKEHYTHYDIFIKDHPTTLFIFKNPVLWGASDSVAYDLLDEESKTNFRNLCYYRYDLTDIKKCEDFFRY